MSEEKLRELLERVKATKARVQAILESTAKLRRASQRRVKGDRDKSRH